MPSRSEIAYFGAGPAPLPTAAIEQSAQAFVNFQDTGLSLAEISHRSPTANKILSDAKDALATLYDIPTDEYDVLFMQAGGTGEFSATVQNLVGYWIEKRRRKAIAELGEGKDAEVLDRVKREVEAELKVDYLVTGSWSLKASQEASRLLGAKYVNVAVDARKSNNGKFGKIPDEKEWKLTPKGSAFTYYCDNETVDGVEFPGFPKSLESTTGAGEDDDERIVVADMSSNFLSRKIDVRKFGVIFGGAQKNLGITGITVVIIRKSLLSLVPPPTFLHALSPVLPTSGALPPIIFSFSTIASNNSLYNTLPIFNLYVATVVLQMLVSTFGQKKVSGQEEVADRKAALIYGALDAHPDTYHVVPDKSVRSRMNICFRIISGTPSDGQVVADEAKEKAFLAGAEKRGLLGLKGHRSVGGMRASNYNAVLLESAQKLADYLVEFAKS
ncbi:phosphoserine aminotransferase [Capronia coronata CBS 617.96]|uniref:phosphoserine transaminase n=1 Tax=Capronia coronata CBS 617.96 TaxID=1182541 RepID=W9XT91_9EURO|nr:phosphoserine aminotransferase [Capronia coronata CBS 617.96]EXJ80555.1 phosphoserine aminotransferase [Capronia coronata CBS 617.96]